MPGENVQSQAQSVTAIERIADWKALETFAE